MEIKFRQITTIDEFQSLKEQWNRLVKATDVDHAFMRHEWFDSWVKHLKPESKLAIQTAWDDNRLVAIAPLHIVKIKRKGISFKFLAFMKSSVTPRCNFIIDEAVNKKLFFDSILSSKGWDVIELQSLDREDQLVLEFIDYLKLSRNFVIENGIQSPYEIIESEWKPYLASLSKNYKKNLRNYLNRLKKSESFEILRIDDYKDFESYYDSLITVSGNSWKAKAGTDLKSNQHMAEFFKELCKLGNDEKMFVLDILIIEGKAAAFSYYLRNQNRLVALRWEYDEEYSYYMPGLVLHNHCLQQICESGEQWEYDLSGDATTHKLRLLKNIRKHIDITIGRPGFFGNMIMMVKKMLVKSSNITNEF